MQGSYSPDLTYMSVMGVSRRTESMQGIHSSPNTEDRQIKHSSFYRVYFWIIFIHLQLSLLFFNFQTTLDMF